MKETKSTGAGVSLPLEQGFLHLHYSTEIVGVAFQIKEVAYLNTCRTANDNGLLDASILSLR